MCYHIVMENTGYAAPFKPWTVALVFKPQSGYTKSYSQCDICVTVLIIVLLLLLTFLYTDRLLR